jgi:hypothetical protein
MSPEAVARRAAELATVWPLPAEDWGPIIDQAIRIPALLATLDELPLDQVEPASLGPVHPPRTGRTHE